MKKFIVLLKPFEIEADDIGDAEQQFLSKMEEGDWTRYITELPLHGDALMHAFLDICPQGQMGEDLDGQTVFYTGLREGSGGLMEPFEHEEER